MQRKLKVRKLIFSPIEFETFSCWQGTWIHLNHHFGIQNNTLFNEKKKEKEGELYACSMTIFVLNWLTRITWQIRLIDYVKTHPCIIGVSCSLHSILNKVEVDNWGKKLLQTKTERSARNITQSQNIKKTITKNADKTITRYCKNHHKILKSQSQNTEKTTT